MAINNASNRHNTSNLMYCCSTKAMNIACKSISTAAAMAYLSPGSFCHIPNNTINMKIMANITKSSIIY